MNEMLTANSNISHYRIISKIGAGGMGEVYLAHDTRLNRRVALKVLPADLINDRERLHRFEQEAQAASALNHPNIITIHEIGADGDTHYLAIEFIEGETLRRRLQTTRLEIRETLNIATQIAAALDTAHRSGIVHRDIKPENIMLREDGLVKVLDFGLAKLTQKKDGAPFDSQAPTLAQVETRPGAVMGTVAYMSPEQARGLEVDARTDIFSLGVVLYEMLTGRLPFAGATTSDMIAAILKSEPAPLAENTPLELQRIVRKTLQKHADERYQTVKDLLIDLKALKQEQDFTAELERSGKRTKADQAASTQDQSFHAPSNAEYIASGIKQHKGSFTVALAMLLFAALSFGYWYYNHRSSTATQIESIAVLPFVNASGNADVEYLSDGMTESLITNLSQLPNLNVKASGSVFRYKGKEVEPRKVGAELSVQAVLLGRVVQRGNNLTLYTELVDADTENILWKADYNRPMTNLVALQSEIARDVSSKLQLKLSGADEQKVAKNYTANTEAYQLYLKGRYHTRRLTRAETDKGIAYYQQAIAIDPSYALAYAGLSRAYRSVALTSDVPSNETMPKAKAAALRAMEIDGTLADAHLALGTLAFWYEWDWQAAEKHYLRALELDPNNADSHMGYAHLLSNTARHEKALIEAKRARELDPLSLSGNTLDGQFLFFAGKDDEALDRLQKTIDLDPNFWLTHLVISRVYSEKGMHEAAIAASTRAKELSKVNSESIALIGYSLAKSGKQAEARAELEGLLKLAKERYVPPYNIALVYNSLGERDKTLEWLEKGYEQRDLRMVFLKVEPKWNNLRDDPRFQDLLRRVGFPQ